MTSATPLTYALDSLDLRKLLRRVAAKALTPRQAEQLLAQANEPGVGLVRGFVGGLVGLVFLGVGAMLLRWAVASYVEKQTIASRARQTTGQVVALSRHGHGNKGPTYAPVVRYQVGNRTYQLEGLATSPAAYRVGQTLRVQYDPARPAAGQLRSFVDQWLLLVLAAGVGCLLTSLGLWVTWTIAQTGLWPARVECQRVQQVLAQLAAGQLTAEAAHGQLRPGTARRPAR